MAIEKMSLVQLTGSMQALDETLMRCLSRDDFHLELPSFSANVHGFSSINEENPYRQKLNALRNIASTAGIELQRKKSTNPVVNVNEEKSIDDISAEISALFSKKQELLTAVEQNSQALRELEHLKNLEVSFDDIFSCEYIKVRFGRLPHDSFPKLRYYDDRMFIFIELSKNDEYHWGFYFTTHEFEAEIDDIFSSLFFQRIRIPDYVHGTPEFAKINISESYEKAKSGLEEINNKITDFVKRNTDYLNSIYSRYSFLNESFDLRKYVAAYNNRFYIIGFLVSSHEGEFKRHFDSIDTLELEFKPPDSDTRHQVPTKLKNNRLFRPFQTFIDMFGMPSYNEIDPTPMVGVTYMLLFGIMFGDLGQGLAMSLIGVLLWFAKKMEFGKILIRIGLCSAVFGVVYGSVFGLEHVLDPLYKNVFHLKEKPIEVLNPDIVNRLLISAIGLGVVLIVASISLNILNGIKRKDLERALFSQNGVAGLVFYVALLIGILSKFVGEKSLLTKPYIVIFLVIPLLIIMLKEPISKLLSGSRHLEFEDGIGSFFIDSFFELFESLLSFLTNTMSFVRVGAFVISHAGMMTVVLTLMHMTSGSKSIIVMIFGNLFVMALEGFIVGIQILRLEFYEMFSRYFDGQGKNFVAVSEISKQS